MAEDLHYSSRSDNKRKFDDQSNTSPAAPTSTRRPTGFSAPITSPPSEAAAPPSYGSVPPPPDGIQLAKQRAQEIAARIFSDAEAKRPKLENGGGPDASTNRGFGFDQPHTLASQFGATASTPFASYGYAATSKKIDIPNGKVGVIIGRSGETIKYLQAQSGARIQVTRDMDADPHSQTRPVELIGTAEQISKAEQLVNDVIAEAESGGPGIVAARKLTSTPGAEHFSMKVPNNKVGLIIGKGGETIKNMQATSGARIQVIPLHLAPGDPSTERTVHIDGTTEQVETAKQLVNDVISEVLGEDGISFTVWELSSDVNRSRNQQAPGGYRPPRPPANWGPPGGPMQQQTPQQQPGFGYMQQPQYSLPQPPYAGYPPASSAGWDPSSNMAAPPTYDYYSGSSAPADSNSYDYSQAAYYTQPDFSQQGYTSISAQDGSAQPPGQSTTAAPQGYVNSQQAAASAVTGYGGLPPASSQTVGGYPSSLSLYGVQSPQGQQKLPTMASQAGYSHGQPPAYGQAAQPSAYTSGAGYGGPSYVQQQQTYGDSYGGMYAQPHQQSSYSNDATTQGSYEAGPTAQAALSGMAKASPQS